MQTVTVRGRFIGTGSQSSARMSSIVKTKYFAGSLLYGLMSGTLNDSPDGRVNCSPVSPLRRSASIRFIIVFSLVVQGLVHVVQPLLHRADAGVDVASSE